MLELLAKDTGIWVAISFITFCLLAFKLGRKSIIDKLDGRINEVKKEIETAERLQVEAQELLAQYQRKQRDAEQEAKTMVDEAKEQAKALRKSAKADLEELMERREVHLTARIKRIEENAIADIRNQAAELAVAATTEAIIQTLDDKKGGKLIDASVSSIAKQVN